MYYEWLVCNSSEITFHKFPELSKTLILEDFYNQEYRIWETPNTISLYQPGKRTIVLFKSNAGLRFLFGTNDYYKLELLTNNTYNVYHGQII